MRHADLVTGASRIRKALENLERAWDQASEGWDDAVSRRFAEEYLEPIVPKSKVALEAMGRMQLLLEQAERDCEG